MRGTIDVYAHQARDRPRAPSPGHLNAAVLAAVAQIYGPQS